MPRRFNVAGPCKPELHEPQMVTPEHMAAAQELSVLIIKRAGADLGAG
jgi:hypothetical protein